MTQAQRVLETAWLAVNGRVRSESLSACDGFRGEYPFASVITVAEGTAGDARSAGIAVSVIRDVFAEGVAFRVGEALVEAFHEAGERIRSEELRGCSVTSAAFIGREVWIAHAGASRAFLAEAATASALTDEHTLASEMKLGPRDAGYRLRSRDLTRFLGQQDLKPQTLRLELTPSQRIVLLTPGIWHHATPARIAACAAGRTDPCQAAEAIVRESRVRFRRSGGAAAVAGEPAGRITRRRRRWFAVPAIILLCAAAFFVTRGASCRGGPESGATVVPGGSDSAAVPWVMPIQALPEEEKPAEGPALPVRCVVFGEIAGLPGPDTLDAFVTPPPDSVYENIPRGVYYVAGDSLTAPFAREIAARLGLGDPVGLDRIVVIREYDVPSFKAWLPGVDAGDASRTAVVVETQSSVAGGAPWIRNYAVYANGNRSRQGEPSVYTGLGLEGMTAGLDPGCYSILIAP
ncbi:MAG: hypothetical protein QUS11_03925 [Candidatus Fermentibacter sp.]|nr:hypothetical protein [Candidatus Fermentibacter sp.]